MKGQYTTGELRNLLGIFVSSVTQFIDGFAIKQSGKIMNYYRRESDGSWTNYDCKTVI